MAKEKGFIKMWELMWNLKSMNLAQIFQKM